MITLATGIDGRGDTITFAVEDSGIGMTEEQLAKLFQRFQQTDASTTRQFGGTGLGLALTKAFAKRLGGDVEVRSEYGKGSTVSLMLPAVLNGAPEVASPLDTGTASRWMTRKAERWFSSSTTKKLSEIS